MKEGASSLIKLANKLEKKSGESAPSFLMVLTALGPSYTQADGVLVVPLNLLKK